MYDGQGSVTYSYNNLAQLTSEMRSFSGLGYYSLSYGYNLAGELNSVSNQWGAQVGYGYDKAGRLTNVSGSGYAGISNYASLSRFWSDQGNELWQWARTFDRL